MKLTLKRRFKYAWNVLTYREKHSHCAQIKGLELFKIGYQAGIKDEKLDGDK